jgi:hypothetical protein
MLGIPPIWPCLALVMNPMKMVRSLYTDDSSPSLLFPAFLLVVCFRSMLHRSLVSRTRRDPTLFLPLPHYQSSPLSRNEKTEAVEPVGTAPGHAADLEAAWYEQSAPKLSVSVHLYAWPGIGGLKLTVIRHLCYRRSLIFAKYW